MPAISSIFLVIAFMLAITVGPQTRPWTWGAGLLALGISVSAAFPVFWKKGRITADFGLISFGMLVAAWFGWRAWMSPVAEFSEADLMLLAGVAGAFVSLRAIEGNLVAERILTWGIALLLLANIAAAARQLADPSFSPVFGSRPPTLAVTGGFAHYNEMANYLIASAMLVGAAGLFGRHARPTRVLLVLIAVGGLAGVWFTRSRGGIFGAAVGCGVFAAVALIMAKRRGERWFAPALVAIPLLAFGIGAFLLKGWHDAQIVRQTAAGVDVLLDNDSRLYLLGIALSCIGLHPLSGGGSRSFSWECFKFADGKVQGDIITHKPELVHNELVQAATDYGLIGAGLLIGLLGTLLVVAIIRTLFAETSREPDSGDAWRLGGLAALSGMFVQSCFSFVFHLLPGILLLGICLGQISRSSPNRRGTSQVIGSKILLTAAALACMMVLLPFGWKGVRVTQLLWPSYFSKVLVTSAEAKMDALEEALRIWPQSTLYQERALISQEASVSGQAPNAKQAAEQAIGDYEKAERLHPFDPNPAINRANLLSQLKRDDEAEDAYDLAIRLQGGMEPSFRSHFSLANHLMRKAVRQFSTEDPGPALASMEIAAQQMEVAVKKMHWVTQDMIPSRVAVQESLGTAREANGDYKGAMEAYDFTTTLDMGAEANYRAGLLNGKLAAAAWNGRRPAEALGYFLEAKRRIHLVTGPLPQGVTQSQCRDYLAYLDRTIAFLQGAKIEPVLIK
jgi:hypothetical protein